MPELSDDLISLVRQTAARHGLDPEVAVEILAAVKGETAATQAQAVRRILEAASRADHA